MSSLTTLHMPACREQSAGHGRVDSIPLCAAPRGCALFSSCDMCAAEVSGSLTARPAARLVDPPAVWSPARPAVPAAGLRARPRVVRVLFGLVLGLVLLAGGCAERQVLVLPESAHMGQPPTSDTARSVVATARGQLGVPYRAGGLDPRSGFDCSGFIWWTYHQNGINLPRTTAEQATAGAAVPGNVLRPADILVFRTGSGMHGLHTGIYTGNGRFVHSPKPGATVREEVLDIPYWRRNFIAARRVVWP